MNRYLAAVLIIIAAAAFHFNPENFIADDAYFYLQIAHNISQGNGSTFHQITPTNGYHPLWMLCCVIGAYITGGDRLTLLHAMAIVQIFFYVISLYLLYRIAKKLDLHFLIAGIFVLTFVMVNSGGMRLFESHLTIMLQLATLSLFIDLLSGARSLKISCYLGILLGLVFLSRLDAFFFIVPLAGASIWIVFRGSGSIMHKIGNVLLAALPASLLAGIYLTYNLLNFGHFIPISGLIKSTYPQAHFSLNALGPHGKIAVLASIIMLGILLWMYLQDPKRQTMKRVVVYSILLMSVVLQAFYIAMYSWGSQWYYTTGYVALAITAMDVFTSLESFFASSKGSFAKSFGLIVNTSILVLMLLATGATVSKTFYNYSLFMTGTGQQKIQQKFTLNPGRKVADILKQHLKPGASIFVFDAPGILAFYTDFKILPADGLMNDLAYDRDLLDKGIESYLTEKQVQYYLGPMPKVNETAESATLKTTSHGSEFIVKMTTPLSKKSAGLFRVKEKEAFVMPPPLRPYGSEQPNYALWKIN